MNDDPIRSPMIRYPIDVPRHVSVNGVQVGLKSLPTVLSRHSVTVVLVNDDEIYKVSLRGSGSLLRHGDRYYLVCCRHQVVGEDLSRVGFFSAMSRS